MSTAVPSSEIKSRFEVNSRVKAPPISEASSTSHSQTTSPLEAFEKATPYLLGAGILGLLWLEYTRPLRSSAEDKLKHDVRNGAVAAMSALAIHLTEKPATQRLSRLVVERKIGLLPKLGLPPWLETTAAVVLFDYTLYLWHVLTHKTKFLWRFHQVHHEDLDLTATTAVRFHFAEMILSVAWRCAQVIVIGASARSLKFWQTLTLFEILFHHSNIRLPLDVERALSRFIVTPRMHAIHHSTVREETDSNWSSGLTIWDWLHGTLRLDVPQESIRIGVPAYGTSEDVKFMSLMKQPFQTQRPAWTKQIVSEFKRSHFCETTR